MRIAMLAWESMHSVAVGGLAPHITELSAALVRRGHEVHVFTRPGPNQSRYDWIDGVHYHRCPSITHPDFITNVDRMCDSFIWHVGETEHFLGGRFDIVHGHDWLTTHAVVQAKDYRGSPTVFTVHSTEYGRCGNILWNDDFSRRIRDLEWQGTYVADRVICVSKSLGREISDLYSVPLDKVFCIYNGVKVAKFDVPVDVRAVRDKCAINGKDAMVLFCGRVTWQKGPDLLLDAIPDVVRTHPHTKFVFAGDGDMRNGLEQRSKAMGIANDTRFLGHRNGGELVGLFKSADVVCVPSRNEPFGIVILEAWSASKPVVATRMGGPAEFVDHGETGLTVPLDVSALRDGLMALLEDRPRAEAMGVRGRQVAESKFTWDATAEETEKVYENVLQLRGRKSSGIHALSEPGTGGRATPRETRRTATHQAVPDAPQADDDPARIRQRIQQRAYDIYVARRGSPGDAMGDWSQAEKEIMAELSQAKSEPPRPRSIEEHEVVVRQKPVKSAQPAKIDVSAFGDGLPFENAVQPEPVSHKAKPKSRTKASTQPRPDSTVAKPKAKRTTPATKKRPS